MVMPIVLSSVKIHEVDMKLRSDGRMDVIIIGTVLDENGAEVKGEVLKKFFTELQPGTQSDINGVMRNLSEEFNYEFTGETDNTWVDL